MPRAWEISFGLVLGCLSSWGAEELGSRRAEGLRPELLKIKGPRGSGLGFLPAPWLPSTLARKPLSSVTAPLFPVTSPRTHEPFIPLTLEHLSVKLRGDKSRGGGSEGSGGEGSEESEGLGAEDSGAEELKAEELKAQDLKAEEIKAEELKARDLKAGQLKAQELEALRLSTEELKGEDLKGSGADD